jgi:hypothetical protein
MVGASGLGTWCAARFDQRVRSIRGSMHLVMLRARVVRELRIRSNSEARSVVVVTIGVQVTVGGSGGHG